MTTQPEKGRLVQQWVARAEEDLQNAEHTLTLGENGPVGTVCFHAQQCAEKYLKALLTWHEIEFPKTHDLVVLLNRLQPGLVLDVTAADVRPLNRYSIEARYPGDWEPINLQEATSAVQEARRVRAAVRPLLPQEVLNGMS